MSDTLVIIPTYNEIENIESIIAAVMQLHVPFDILVVDDNSPDGTADAVRRMQKQYPGRVHLHERPGKLGLGTAYIEGFKLGLEMRYEYLIEMDADFSHDPRDLIRLRQACLPPDGADVAVGSRYITGVNVVNWPMGRVLMSYYASVYVRLITGTKVRDTTAGFVCWRRQVLETMELDKVHFKGYAFQIEMKYTATKCGFTVTEVPIIFVNRVLGTSKMSSGIFSEGFFGVMRLRLQSLWRKYPRKPQARQQHT